MFQKAKTKTGKAINPKIFLLVYGQKLIFNLGIPLKHSLNLRSHSLKHLPNLSIQGFKHLLFFPQVQWFSSDKVSVEGYVSLTLTFPQNI